MAMTAEVGKNLQMQAQINQLKGVVQNPNPQAQPMGPPPGSAPQQITQSQMPPQLEQVRNQLQNQMGTGIQ